ncbi:MAG: hypothetical protein IBX68_07645 [Dehalococcoidia bacterium]|nr:hypothetical protein [Dehalococcoidia bacterium]
MRHPRQSLCTFGVTNVRYYLVTEPSYAELTGDVTETVIREGRVVAQRPRIVTPYYLANLEGFSSDARTYFDMLANKYGPDSPGLFYTYRNEPGGLNIVSDNRVEVINKLNDEIDRKNDPLASIIKGEDDLWDVSLMRFIFELTCGSLQDNLRQLEARGLLGTDSCGVPIDARIRIEKMFQQVSRGERKPADLESEIKAWNLFEEYQDRFFSLFRSR